jgi:hypothetical protein
MKPPRRNEIQDVTFALSHSRVINEFASRNPWLAGFAIFGDKLGRPIDKKDVEEGCNSAFEVLALRRLPRRLGVWTSSIGDTGIIPPSGESRRSCSPRPIRALERGDDQLLY